MNCSADGVLRLAASDFVQANGLAFSPDGPVLYAADTVPPKRNMAPVTRQFAVGIDNRLSGGAVIADCTTGAFDGFRLDADGRIWTSAADGVHCYDSHGMLLG